MFLLFIALSLAVLPPLNSLDFYITNSIGGNTFALSNTKATCKTAKKCPLYLTTNSLPTMNIVNIGNLYFEVKNSICTDISYGSSIVLKKVCLTYAGDITNKNQIPLVGGNTLVRLLIESSTPANVRLVGVYHSDLNAVVLVVEDA